MVYFQAVSSVKKLRSLSVSIDSYLCNILTSWSFLSSISSDLNFDGFAGEIGWQCLPLKRYLLLGLKSSRTVYGWEQVNISEKITPKDQMSAGFPYPGCARITSGARYQRDWTQHVISLFFLLSVSLLSRQWMEILSLCCFSLDSQISSLSLPMYLCSPLVRDSISLSELGTDLASPKSQI